MCKRNRTKQKTMTVDPWLLLILFGLLDISCLFICEEVDEETGRIIERSPIRHLLCALLKAMGIVVFVAVIWVVATLTFCFN